MNNPLLTKWSEPYDIPDFRKLKPEHYRPAFEKAIEEVRKSVEAISDSIKPATFENTIVALERVGELLGRLGLLLFNLNSAETSDKIQEVTREVSPLLTRLANDITLNQKLFDRINAIYQERDKLITSEEDMMLVENKYRSFMKGGASLSTDKRDRFRAISEKLAMLSLKFDENLLAETNRFFLNITAKEDLAGLPEGSIEAAADLAAKKNLDGWAFNLHAPSYIPFMQYADNRMLREKMFRAYMSRAIDGEFDNRQIIKEIVALRLEKARLLGFRNHAEYALGDKMAENPESVTSFLEDLSRRSHPFATRDYNEVMQFAEKNGHKASLERWDWAYWSEKLKKELYSVDDEEFRPYFELGKALNATFLLASELFGIQFKEYKNDNFYHDEVSGWEVIDSNGVTLALLLTDFFPREGKSGGAWMTNYREQSIRGDKNIRPVVSIVTNFPKPGMKRPSLLSFNELTTLLHEFGHALHSIMSQCKYESLAGTNVARDFVELPSQFMENFAYEMDWLTKWASHYKTGDTIPPEMIDKLKALSLYNEGYACDRQLSFGFLDMAYHTIEDTLPENIADFENGVTGDLDLFPKVDNICFSASFAHIFAGGYSAGYYGYKWAEVLDADAFGLFKEKGVFCRECGDRFRRNILERGGSAKPGDLYRRFRGHNATLDPFLIRSGFINNNR